MKQTKNILVCYLRPQRTRQFLHDFRLVEHGGAAPHVLVVLLYLLLQLLGQISVLKKRLDGLDLLPQNELRLVLVCDERRDVGNDVSAVMSIATYYN